MFAQNDFDHAMRFDMLRDAVAEMSVRLSQLATLIDRADKHSNAPAPQPRSFVASERLLPATVEDAAWLAAQATRQLRIQNARRKFLPKEISRDYGWTMLLDLFANCQQGKKVSVSSACLSSEGPPTTALRWLDVLERAKLISRDADPQDGRRIYVSLTPLACEQIVNWLRYAK